MSIGKYAGVQGYAREIFLEKRIEELQRIYKKAQKSLRKKLQRINITEFQKTRTDALLYQVNKEIIALNHVVRKWTKKGIYEAYQGGLEIAEKRLQGLGITKYVNYDARVHKTAMNVLIDDVTVDFLTANQSIKNTANRYIRLTQQRLLEDKEISKLLAQGMIEGETRRTTSDTLLKEFRKRIGAEQFIVINGRRFQPDKYSALVTRTRFIEASSRANINTSLQYGVDLMQISVHYHPQIDPCLDYQGKIYSISGGDPDFPPLEESPPFHVNCKHQILSITRESLDDKGLAEGAKEFSKSKRKAGTFTEYEKEIVKKK